MSSYSEYLKSRKVKDIKWFFGENTKVAGSKADSIRWVHFVDNDNIIIITKNVKYWCNKDQYVLFVDNDKIVYLKDWQVEEIKNWNLQEDAYAVKLNRNWFKVYNIHYEQHEFVFEKEDTFDSLVEVAKEQDINEVQTNNYWKLGHYNFVD